jgi:hypothetical protein
VYKLSEHKRFSEEDHLKVSKDVAFDHLVHLLLVFLQCMPAIGIDHFGLGAT